MSATVEQYGDESIILLTFVGTINAEIVRDAFAQCTEITETIEGTVYRITDIRQGEATFRDVLGVIAQVRARVPGASGDPKIKGVFVGAHPLAKLYADFLRQFGIQTPFFKTVEEALDYVRMELKRVPHPM
jgi:hypothetical protein